MRIGLIGCGRVGVTLFYLLKRNNQIIGVYDTDMQKQHIATKTLRIRKNPQYKDLVMRSDALFLGTPDHAILRAYEKAELYMKEKKYVFHFSGLLPAQALPKRKNIFRASTHPFATFPKIERTPFGKYTIFVQGDAPAMRTAKKIFDSKHFTLKSIKKEQKVIYHLIGVISSNLIVGLISSIYRMAGKINLREKDIERLVFPMIEETLRNIRRYKLKNSLSGPVQRGDIEVIEKHLRTLRKDKNLLEIYKVLSRALLENVIKDQTHPRLKEILR